MVLEGEIAAGQDPQQERGIKGIVPKAPPKKYQHVNTVRSLHFGFADEYQLQATKGYLKANSTEGMPLTIFLVSGHLYRTFVQYNGRLYTMWFGRFYNKFVLIYYLLGARNWTIVQ